jgi:aminopeptidase N
MNPIHTLRSWSALGLVLISTLACQVMMPTPTLTRAPVTPTVETVPLTSTPSTVTDPDIGASGMGDSLYPDFGNGGYDVQSYILDIAILDVPTSDLSAVTTIEAKATQELSSFNLDFIGFDITSITVNNLEAGFERDGQELTITPASPLANNQTFTVRVEYAGQPEAMESVALPFQTGWVTYERGIFVLSEPDGSASFYPVNDHPLDKANYTFIVTVPKPFEVAANGILTETTDNGQTSTFHFVLRDPMASYLATINVQDFDVETMQSAGGIPIRNYYASGLSEDVRIPFENQGEMIDYFAGLFGPYPFEVYGALVMDTNFGAALENQTMSIFGLDMINTDNVFKTELTVAHELTHQWFGDSVSLADWSDIWLNEGFASYGEGLWVEHIRGSNGLDRFIEAQYEEVAAYPQYYPPPGSPPAHDLFNGGVYIRGGLVLHALRVKVGDDLFFRILQTYFERYRDGNASTDDFISVSEEVSGEDLTDFFQAWLYDEALPPIPELGLKPTQ